MFEVGIQDVHDLALALMRSQISRATQRSNSNDLKY